MQTVPKKCRPPYGKATCRGSVLLKWLPPVTSLADPPINECAHTIHTYICIHSSYFYSELPSHSDTVFVGDRGDPVCWTTRQSVKWAQEIACDT